ncbi:hypothetical protein EZS27_018213 [termite gut metagenome]|jgi:hypothetical protein|uniref:Uncharacterized protein n=1 Tax=termite gut metagenome TaxID=433724 RepID=A0A5J4RIL4_9ZZZZ
MDLLANVCSILGLIVSIVTIILVGSINKNIKTVEKKVLFNTRSEDHIFDLRKLKDEYSNSLRNWEDYISIKSVLKRINTKSNLLLKIIPHELRKDCNSLIIKTNQQYRTLAKREGKWYNFYKKPVSQKELLWETYDSIDAFINKIDSYKSDKDIVK